MHGSGAAEGHQQPGPRVDATLHADDPQGVHHLLHRDGDDPPRAVVGLKTELITEAGHCVPRAVGVERDRVVVTKSARQASEHHVRVRDRRECAPASVRGRPGNGSGGARTHAKRAAAIAPGDAPTPGGHRLDVQHRQVDRVTGHRAPVRARRLAALDQGDVA